MKVRVMVTDHIYPGSTNNPAHVYTREALEGAVERFNARREKRPEYGELHVSNLTLEVDLNHVSHEVVNLEMIDNEVVATIESVKTPLGVSLVTTRSSRCALFRRRSPCRLTKAIMGPSEFKWLTSLKSSPRMRFSIPHITELVKRTASSHSTEHVGSTDIG